MREAEAAVAASARLLAAAAAAAAEDALEYRSAQFPCASSLRLLTSTGALASRVLDWPYASSR